MKIVGLIIAGIVAAALLLGAFLYFGARGIATRPMTENEKQLLLTLSKFHPDYIARLKLQQCESFVANTNLDYSLELEYCYDSKKDESSPFLYFKSEAEINHSVRDAQESYRYYIGAYKTGASLVEGRKLVPQSKLFTLGEHNFTATVEDNGNVVGTIVVARQGKIVHALFTLGMTFDSRDELESLMQPVFAASRDWR